MVRLIWITLIEAFDNTLDDEPDVTMSKWYLDPYTTPIPDYSKLKWKG
jgi:hypothetical protein